MWFCCGCIWSAQVLSMGRIVCFALLSASGALGDELAARWPAVAGRVGPYGGIHTVQEADRLGGEGFNLTLLSTSSPVVLAAFRRQNITYIDGFLWGLVDHACTEQYKG